MKLQISGRRIAIVFLAVCCLTVALSLIVKIRSKPASDPCTDPFAMIERIETALDGAYEKQAITVLASTTTYASKDGSNDINYRVLWTSYYEKDPREVTGLNIDALKALFPVDSMESCQELKIKDWDAAFYKKGESAYLCWTCSPELTLVLEYNPELVEDSEIIKMAESVEPEE